MDWIIDLFTPGNTSTAATLVLYSFVIASGIYLGKIKFFGVSLGVTFVLFVGILVGHFGYTVNPDTLKFMREFGLILFIFRCDERLLLQSRYIFINSSVFLSTYCHFP